MLETLTGVVREIVVIVIIATILELLLPRHDFRPFVRMVVGLVLMLAILSPVRSLLKMPDSFLEPVIPQFAEIGGEEIAARQKLLQELNWELTLTNYYEKLYARAKEALLEINYLLVDIEIEAEEDPQKKNFGEIQTVSAVIKEHEKDEEMKRIAPVEEVRIGEEEGIDFSVEQEESKDLSDVVNVLAEVFDVKKENIAVRVIN